MTMHQPFPISQGRKPVDDARIQPDPGGLEDLDAAATAYAEGRLLRADLIGVCLPFAGRISRRFRGRGESLEDIEQVARLGLVKAIDRYDPARGSFTAYAVITISGEIKRHLRDRTWGVHVPRRMQELILEVGHTATDLTGSLSRTPTIEEIARRMDVPVGTVLKAMASSASFAPSSLNAPLGDGGGEIGDLMGELDGALEMVDDRLTVAGLLLRMPARERRILALRFFGNHTQAEIAAELGISQMHVSRLLTRSLTWLREAMLSDTPLPCAGAGESGLELTVVDHTAGRVVRVRGEVDRDNAERLRIGLRGAITGTGSVVVDLSAVPLMDAAGIAVLRDAASAAAVADAELTVSGAQPYVARVLSFAGMSNLISR
jgi:RNA polymerase sigma-B factor